MTGGYMGKILDIDLDRNKVSLYEVSDETRRKYLGGKGLAARILYDTVEKGVDPLSPKNVFIVMTGPMTGTNAPCTSRFGVTTKSPLTGTIVASNSGSSFGIRMKKAGYDGLLLRGAAKSPVYIDIAEDTKENNVQILDASKLWGLDTKQTQEKIATDKKVAIAIGPAGENLVKYAAIISTERANARGGVGAVLGAKKVKAIAANGNKEVPIAKPEKFKKATKRWIKVIKKNPVTSTFLPRFGTAGLLSLTNAKNVLPTRNFQKGSFEHADDICGEAMAERLKGRTGCMTCPIRCGRVVEVKGEKVKGPEYETMALLGADMGVGEIEKIFEWNYLCDLLGIDTMSTAGTIAFTMELCEKGMLDAGLAFGKTGDISQLLHDIAYRKGIGNDMAEGSKRMSEKYGGKEFAIHSKGLEAAGYEPRCAVGHGLGYATANRGACHINGGYLVYTEAIGPVTTDPWATRGKPEFTVLMQDLLDGIGCAITCIFTSYALYPGPLYRISPYGVMGRRMSKMILKMDKPLGKAIRKIRKRGEKQTPLSITPYERVVAAVTGWKFHLGDFLLVGERSFNMERLFNVREGFSKKDDTLPKRLLTEPSLPYQPKSVVPLDEMLPKFYEVRGWDENGVPTKETLEMLGIEV